MGAGWGAGLGAGCGAGWGALAQGGRMSTSTEKLPGKGMRQGEGIDRKDLKLTRKIRKGKEKGRGRAGPSWASGVLRMDSPTRSGTSQPLTTRENMRI